MRAARTAVTRRTFRRCVAPVCCDGAHGLPTADGPRAAASTKRARNSGRAVGLAWRRRRFDLSRRRLSSRQFEKELLEALFAVRRAQFFERTLGDDGALVDHHYMRAEPGDMIHQMGRKHYGRPARGEVEDKI